MAEPQSFPDVKLICGMIAGENRMFDRAEERLVQIFGRIDLKSPVFPFDFTDYYHKQMGEQLERKFLSFLKLINPESLSRVKLRTNQLEEEMKKQGGAFRRVVNLDPGYLTASALIMATAKDFAHRVPLQQGIYAHLEYLFTRNGVKVLDWTYPDYRSSGYQDFFLSVRRIYLDQIK